MGVEEDLAREAHTCARLAVSLALLIEVQLGRLEEIRRIEKMR